MKTFRDVKNFAASLSANLFSFFYNRDIIQNISLANLFWLEVIRYSDYDFYLVLRDAPRSILTLNVNGRDHSYDEYVIPEGLKDSKKNQSLQLIFNKSCSNSICYRVNYDKYFYYRLPFYSIDIKVYEKKLLADDKEQKEWLKGLRSTSIYSMQSLVFDFQLSKTHDNSIKLNLCFIHLVANSIQFTYLFPKLLLNVLKTNKFQRNQHSRLADEFVSVLKLNIKDFSVDALQGFSEQLSYLYNETIIREGDENVNYKTILENQQIEEILILIFHRYISLNHPKITDLANEQSALYKIYNNSLVTQLIDEDNKDPEFEPFKENSHLLFNELISIFKVTRSENEYYPFLRKYDLDEGLANEVAYDEARNLRISNICQMFDSIENYKDFLSICFDIPESRLRKHLHNL